jgi:hypothetical protein
VRTTWALLLLVATLAAPSAAADPPADAEIKKLSASLRSRATLWCEARKTAVYKCPSCEGKGRVSYETSEGGVPTRKFRDCSRCVRGWKVKADKARSAYFDVYTPQWRAIDENVKATQAWIDGLATEPAPGVLKGYAIESVEIVGPHHGITLIRETRETEQIAPFAYRWVLLDDAKAKTSSWYQWHDADGAWGLETIPVDPVATPEPPTPGTPVAPVPSTPSASPPKAPETGKASPPPAAPTPVAFEQDALDALGKSLAAAHVKPSLDGAEWRGDVVVVRLLPAGVADQATLDEAVAQTIIPASRVLMRDFEKATSVRLVFLAKYRDRVGDVSTRPYETVSMSRDDFAKIRFENLNRAEALDLFTREPHVYRLEGFTLWWKE